jgi:hypothetical protein
MREQKAYVIPAAIFTGLAVHELFGAFCLLMAIKAKRSPLWLGSFTVYGLVCISVLLNFILLDFVASPYPSVSGYLGNLMALAYLVNFVSTIAIVFLFLTRIKMFFGSHSSFFRMMLALAIWVILVKGAGDYNGAKVSRAFAKGEIKDPTLHPDYAWTPMVMAFGSAFEGIFSAVSSLSFLYYLSDYSNAKSASWRDFIKKVPVRETLRVCFILTTHVSIGIMGTWVVFERNYISHTGFYMVALVYSLEIHFFLDLSYRTSKAILNQIQQTIDNEQGDRKSVRFSIKV